MIMKNTYFSIQVPESCHEDWNEMTPTAQGRFCQACERNLVDFTQMSDTQLVHYFRTNKGKICGRFNLTQLDRKLNYPQATKPIYSKAVGLLFSGLLTASTLEAQQSETAFPLPIVEAVEKEEAILIEGPQKVEETPFEVKGTITDEDGEALIGATVLLKGSQQGTITDIDGKFNMTIPADYNNPVLVFSYTGFTTQEVALNPNNPNVEIELELNSCDMMLLGVVVAGYGHFREPIPETSLWSELRDLFRSFKKNKKAKKEKKAKRQKRHKEVVVNPTTLPQNNSPAFLEQDVLTVYPNPFDQELKLRFESVKEQQIQINIYDESGRFIKAWSESVLQGENEILLNMGNPGLSSGQYHLQMIEEDGKTHHEKLVRITP